MAKKSIGTPKIIKIKGDPICEVSAINPKKVLSVHEGDGAG